MQKQGGGQASYAFAFACGGLGHEHSKRRGLLLLGQKRKQVAVVSSRGVLAFKASKSRGCVSGQACAQAVGVAKAALKGGQLWQVRLEGLWLASTGYRRVRALRGGGER